LLPLQVTLELGGKSPVLVFDDVDIEEAVPWVALAILFNMGQDCCAGSRLFIQRGIHDAFIAKLIEAFKAHKIGDPFDDTSSHGPQVSKEQYEKIMSYIDYGKTDGAKVVYGGGRAEAAAKGGLAGGYWVEPTIFTGCHKGMRIVDDEIFGPVLAVIPFDTEEEATDMANDTEYGLAAGIFSNGASRCMRVLAALKAGTSEYGRDNFYFPRRGS
jgi:aldehyde dehydrogenase (NAD+)